MKRFFAILVIWLGAATAWMVLGSTLLVRSGEVSTALRDEVNQLWGAPIEQRPPEGTLSDPDSAGTTAAAAPSAPEPSPPAYRNGDPSDTRVPTSPATSVVALGTPARLSGSKLDVRLALEHRQKGLIWFPTYTVDFAADYRFENPEKGARELSVTIPLQETNALYEGFEVSSAGKPLRVDVNQGRAVFKDTLAAGASKTYSVKYRSRGTERWSYHLTAGTGRVDGFELNLDTDFADVNFPSGTVSPSAHEAQGGGWHGTWKFSSLVASTPIGVELPQLLNPGPLASRITFFAPLSLLFFFFVVAILAAAQKRELHPLHYFFFSCAFFAFHLLFAYMVDHVSVGPAFAISAAVSVFLVVSYARLFVGYKFAFREMGLSQLIYLVLFSFTFFFDGYTGLSVTIGAIVTLFLVMQITGRKSWSELLGEKQPPAAHCAVPYRCGVAALERAEPAE